MKKKMMTFLMAALLVACSGKPTGLAQTIPTTATIPTLNLPTPTRVLTHTAASEAAEEGEVRDLVESFGKTLQTVSLLAPDAAKEINKRYAEYVSCPLLEKWTSDPSQAPGRTVSSPWPDRIEITNLAKEGSDRYVITGDVVEVTSVEVVQGGAAARIPVRMVVQNDQGRWILTEYTAGSRVKVK